MITIKTKKEIADLKAGGKILATVIYELAEMIKPGVSTADLENYANKRILEYSALPAFKNYKNYKDDPPFPTSLCASINEEIVHAPSLPGRILKIGDIIGLDFGIKYKGLYTDMAVTVGVGKISSAARKLIKVTKNSLDLALKQVKAGNRISDISKAIQTYAERHGYGVVRSLVGHGVGYAVHESPRIPNYIAPNQPNIVLKEGMVLAIEPMLTLGDYNLETLDNGWTQSTVDKSLTAHYENTIVVTKNGGEVITKI